MQFTGSVKLNPLPNRVKGSPPPRAVTVQLGATHVARALNNAGYDMSATWFPCSHVISNSLDECKMASWVFEKSLLTVRLFKCSTSVSDAAHCSPQTL